MYRVNRVNFVNWAWTCHPDKVIDMTTILEDLKGAGEVILDTRDILNNIGWVPGSLCEPPVADEQVHGGAVEFFYKNPFIEDGSSISEPQ